MHRLSVLSITAAVAASSSAFADVNPWDFNVFSRSTITYTGSDFEGAAGAAGNASFNGFSLRLVGGSSPSIPQSFYGGGTLTLSGSINNGGADAAGTVTMNAANINGTVRSGGNLAGTGGSINGAAFFAGSYTAPANQITTGPASYGTPFSAALDLAAASAYFLAASNYAAALANTTLHTNTNGGQIDVTTVSGLNVVTISAAELNSAYAFNVHGPGTLVINVTGTGTVSLDSTTWSYDNGAASTRTLLNYNQATGLNLSSGNVVNILAPNAAVNFSSGNLNGNLVAGSLAGSGQVNWVGTAQFSTIPAPGAAGTLALTALAATRRKRRR